MFNLLETLGLIKLKEGIDKTTANVADIAENPKNLVIDANYCYLKFSTNVRK